jgi:deoxyribodipyrimidine photolyase-like uncharacterized protein
MYKTCGSIIKRKYSKATFYRKVSHNTAIALELSQPSNDVDNFNNNNSRNINNDINFPKHISEKNISDNRSLIVFNNYDSRNDYDNSPNVSYNNLMENLNSSNSTVDNDIDN